MSTLTAFPLIQERSEATPGLWNTPFSTLSANIAAVDSTLLAGHFQQLSIGSTPPSYLTTAAVTIEVNSAYSDYLYLVDSSAQKSSYIIGSRAGGTADGLNIWDVSGSTMIVGFSKQSIRAYAPVIGTLYDTGGNVTNVKSFGALGNGSADDTTLIQNALNATVGGGTILFPSGTYRVTSTLSAGARQILRGQGWASILSSAFSGPLITVNANTTDAAVGPAVMSGLADGFAMEDIALFSNSTQSSIGMSIVSYSPSPSKTVRILGVRNVRIQGFDVGTDLINTQGVAFYLTQFLGNRVGMLARDNSQLGLLGQCDFRANTYIGTWLSSTSSTQNIIGDRLYGWVFDRCHWELNTGMGLVFDGAGYNLCLGCKFEQNNNSFSHFTDHLSGYRPDGNVFLGCTWNGTTSVNTVLQVDMPVGVGNSFENNNFNVGASSGLSFGPNTAHNVLWNCSISGGGASFVTYVTDRSGLSQNIYFLPSLGYVRLQGSGQSIDWMSPSLHTTGSALIPAISFTSEQSLGFYRSVVSTIKMSYGTLDLSATAAVQGPLNVVGGGINVPSNARIRLSGSGNMGIQSNAGDASAVDFVGSGNAIGLILRANVNQIHFGNSENSFFLGASDATYLKFSGGVLWADGAILAPTIAWTSEKSLGLYRSGVSTVGLSYGALALPDGSSTTPSLGYSSNSSLGFYSSGVQTIAQSYGTLNLATNAVRLSMRTLAASSVTASAANTNVAVNEVVVTVQASGASFAVNSGGTTWIFSSVASAKNT